MTIRRFVVVLVVAAMLVLTPSAHASPPDQTWIAGLYDNADYDDVVLAVAGSVASVDPAPPYDRRGVDFAVGVVASIDARLHATPSLSSNHTRAPPAS